MNTLTEEDVSLMLHPLLLGFLKDRDILSSFVENYNNASVHFPMGGKEPYTQLSIAFSGKESKEGYSYWESIQVEFSKYVDLYDETNQNLLTKLQIHGDIFKFIDELIISKIDRKIKYKDLDDYEQLVLFDWSESKYGFEYWFRFIANTYPMPYRYRYTINKYKEKHLNKKS